MMVLDSRYDNLQGCDPTHAHPGNIRYDATSRFSIGFEAHFDPIQGFSTSATRPHSKRRRQMRNCHILLDGIGRSKPSESSSPSGSCRDIITWNNYLGGETSFREVFRIERHDEIGLSLFCAVAEGIVTWIGG